MDVKGADAYGQSRTSRSVPARLSPDTPDTLIDPDIGGPREVAVVDAGASVLSDRPLEDPGGDLYVESGEHRTESSKRTSAADHETE